MASEIISHDLTNIELDPHQPLRVESYPNLDNVVTEDDTPVDNIFAEKQQRLLPQALFASWSGPGGNRRFVVMSNVGLFSVAGQPPFVPDTMLSVDVEVPANLWPKGHRSYFIWRYGKPPDIVIEVVSNSEGGEDTVKLAGYARIGVPYYVIFDPENILGDDVLRGYRRDGLTYRPMDLPLWFPEVELGLRLWTGSYEGHEDTWLRWTDRDGNPIPTGEELAELERDRAEQERDRAEQAVDRANQERDRAEQAVDRANQERDRAEQAVDRANQEHDRAEQAVDRANQERDRVDQAVVRANQERDRAERLAEQLRRLGIVPEDSR